MYTFTEQFMADKDNLDYLKTNMMGPNAMRLSEEMASCLEIKPGMRVLDLGCGCGLSTPNREPQFSQGNTGVLCHVDCLASPVSSAPRRYSSFRVDINPGSGCTHLRGIVPRSYRLTRLQASTSRRLLVRAVLAISRNLTLQLVAEQRLMLHQLPQSGDFSLLADRRMA